MMLAICYRYHRLSNTFTLSEKNSRYGLLFYPLVKCIIILDY